MTQAGPDINGNAPYLRFFDGSNRIVEVYRSNKDGKAWLGVADPTAVGGRTYIPLNKPMAVGTWHQVTLHVAPGAVASTATSTVEVWIDDNVTPVLTSTTTNLYTTTKLTLVQLGNEHQGQAMVEYFDDVCIGAS